MCVCACSLKCVDAHGCSGQSTTLCVLTQVIHLLFFLFFFIVVVIIVITLPWYTCRRLRSATGSGFSPSTMWVPGIPSKRGAGLGWEQVGTFTAPEPPFWAVVGFVLYLFIWRRCHGAHLEVRESLLGVLLPSTMWIIWMEFRLSRFVASAFIPRAPTLFLFLFCWFLLLLQLTK